MLYGKTGKTSIQPIIEKKMISFWLRLTQNKLQRLIIYKIYYSFIIKLRNKNQYESQWIEEIVGILQNCGCSIIEKIKIKIILCTSNISTLVSMTCGYNHRTLEYILPIDVHIIKILKMYSSSKTTC